MSFFEELKRRNVVRVAIAYVVASWLLLQLTEVLAELLELPAEVGRIVVLLLVIGFIPALVFAWAFEMTPEGLKREKDIDRSTSTTRQTGRKLDLAIIAMLALVAGYFIWESRFSDRSPVASDAPSEVAAATSGPATSAIGGNAIAVLPFANRSNVEDDLFFTDGIHDDLLTQLARMDGLRVISRTSVMAYRDTNKRIPEIAAELGADKILEGGVQRAGKRIRINAQLIDVKTDQHLWAETFDRELTVDNIFDIQSEITRQIVEAIRGELSPEESRALDVRPTENLAAYEAFLRARAATNLADYGREKYEEAEPLVKLAVDADPDFAQAWALLAEIHGQAVWQGYDTSPQRQQLARDALDRALTLAPDDPSVVAAKADQLYRLDTDYPAAYELYLKAESLAPNDARIVLFRAITERRMGQWDTAIGTFERARKLDPANVFIATQLIDTLGWMNEWARISELLDDFLPRYPDSRDLAGARVDQLMNQHGDLAAARQVFDSIPPNNGTVYFEVANNLPAWERNWEAWTRTWDLPEINANAFNGGAERELYLGQAQLVRGDRESARVLFRHCVERLTAMTVDTRIGRAFRDANLALALAYLGEEDRALELAQQAVDILPRAHDHLFGNNLYSIQTQVLAVLGQHDAAVERLAASVDRPGGLSRWELRLSPGWDVLREHPGFQELIK